MTSRTRNFSILGIVLVLLAAAAFVIEDKSTKLGLDLKGGIELVYQGQPTPQVPTVTPQALDDALETIRKRTDALGVSEPEIQRSGRDQISIGLPDVQNAERAIQQVGSTAQLQFYDWEPNVLGRGPDVPFAGSKALYDSADFAAKQKPKAEQTDVPPGSDLTPAEADKQNDSSATPRYYLFGPDRYPIGNDQKPLREGEYEPSTSCESLLADYVPAGGAPIKYAKDTECQSELEALGSGGPPAGSRVIKVPRGITIVEAEKAPNQSDARSPLLRDRGRLRAERQGDQEPRAGVRPEHERAAREHGVHGQGARGVRARDEADRRARARLRDAPGRRPELPAGLDPEDFFQRFAITLDNQIVSLATIDYQENPEGIDGRNGASIQNIGHHPGRAGPRREPPHRRAADRPEADLADAGLGHARPAGARPGPHRGRGRPRGSRSSSS